MNPLPNSQLSSGLSLSRIALCCLALLLLFIASLLIANPTASLNDFLLAMSGEHLDRLSIAMIYYLSLPRALIAIVSGAALAIAGTLIQQSLQNAFASPATLGINAGAMVATLICGAFAADFLLNWPILIAFTGALLTSFLVYSLARSISTSPINLILVGMAVSLALGAISAGLLMLFEGKLDGFYIWGAGNLAQPDFSRFSRIAPALILLMLLSFPLARRLDLLALGDQLASGLGLNVAQLRLVSVVIAIGLSAIVVSALGMISFLGLIAPHIAKYLGGDTTFKRLIYVALIGALLLLGADVLALSLASSDFLVPAGAMTTLIGAPFMMFLLRHHHHQRGQQVETQDVGISPLWLLKPQWVLSILVIMICIPIYFLIASDSTLSIVLPRLLVAGIAGMGLAVSGLILQILLRNPLASPDVAGLTSSGVLAVVLISSFMPLMRSSMVLVSLTGSMTALLLGYLWLKNSVSSPQRWALMGICLSAFSGTAVSLVMSLSATQSSEALLWLSGAVYAAGINELMWLLPVLLLMIPLLLFGWRWLNLLQLGTQHAQALGLNNRLVITILAALVVIFCAFCVAVVGGISFVGLMAPHLLRVMGIVNSRYLLPGSALMGAFLLMLSDHIAMTMMAPFELPTGLVVSATGGLYFITLLISGKYAFKR